jgi:cytochrome P450
VLASTPYTGARNTFPILSVSIPSASRWRRICIGNHFALMEGHLVLATLAQRVRFSLMGGQRIEPEPLVTLRPKYGIRMMVKRRV